MKKIILAVVILAALTSCDIKKQDKIADDKSKAIENAKKDTTVVQVIDTVYNFGKVADGEIVEYSYRFKNIGNKPLVVNQPVASCGCTVPEKPEKPILPGEMGYIKVSFNSKGRGPKAEKTITVTSNAKPDFPPLILRGDIEDKKQE